MNGKYVGQRLTTLFLIQRQNEKPQRPLTPSAVEVIVISSGDDDDAISSRKEDLIR